MARDILNNTDIEYINTLIALGQSIVENELKLANIETNFSNQSKEYISTLDNLKCTLSLEKQIYSKLGSDIDKISAIIDYLKIPKNKKMLGDNPINLIDFENTIETLLSGNTSKLIITRIANNLTRINIWENINNIKLKTLSYYTLSKDKESGYVYYKDLYKTVYAIECDVINTILNLLNYEINKNNNTKAFLIKAKYMLVFLFPEIENALLENNFEINSELYWTAKAYAIAGKLTNKFFSAYQDEYGGTLIVLGTNKLYTIDNFELTDDKTQAFICIYQILLKAGLALARIDNISYFQSQLQTAFDPKNKKLTEGESTILNILDNANKYKELPKTITLALKKES